MPNQLLTPSQAAALLGVGERHIRQLIADGRIRAQRVDGRIMVDPSGIADRFKLELDSATVQATTLERLRDNAARAGYALDEQELIETARQLLRQTYQHNETTSAARMPAES